MSLRVRVSATFPILVESSMRGAMSNCCCSTPDANNSPTVSPRCLPLLGITLCERQWCTVKTNGRIIIVCEMNGRCKPTKKRTVDVQPPWYPCRFSILGPSCGPTWRAQTCNFTRTKCANGLFQELKRKVIYFSFILSLLNAQFLVENMVRTHAHPPHTARRAEGCQSVILPP